MNVFKRLFKAIFGRKTKKVRYLPKRQKGHGKIVSIRRGIKK